jgi:hypothetical protein
MQNPEDAVPNMPIQLAFVGDSWVEVHGYWRFSRRLSASVGSGDHSSRSSAADRTSALATPDRTHDAKAKSWLDQAIRSPVYVEKTLKVTGRVKEFPSFGLCQNGFVCFVSQVEEKMRGQQGSTPAGDRTRQHQGES